MPDENLYEYVTRRERELTAQISAMNGQINVLRGHLAQHELELTQVQRIKMSTLGSALDRKFGASIAGSIETVTGLHPTNSNAVTSTPHAPISQAAVDLGLYERMTIKELVVRALGDHFKAGGTAIQIRDFIQDAYGRDILPSSLRPQLHRLKVDGILGQEPSTDWWDFQDGKRRHYVWYGPPKMEELQDSDPGIRDALEEAYESQQQKDK
jgi:hypothetical protein